MTLWERIKSTLKREAADVSEGARHLGRTLDEELARKERELNATPAERFDMILEDIEASDSRIGEIEAGLSQQSPSTVRRRPEPMHQLLDAADVSSSPRLDEALAAVTVEFIGVDAQEDTHQVTIDPAVVANESIDAAAVATEVGSYTLVTSVRHVPPNTAFVRADNLHVEDVRLLAAAALAAQLDSR